MLVAYPIRLNEHILVQQSLSVRSECSDQGLAESRPETCGDPRRASADASAAAAFDSFHRRLPTSIQINQLFRQRQVCLKGLHYDQRRRLTVPDENGECLVPGFGQVVGPVAIR